MLQKDAMMEEVSDLELTEMDTSNDMEDIEGDMDDFPEEWMVLDDADDIEATEVHSNQISEPDNSSKNINTSAESHSLLKTDTVTLKTENVPKSDKQFSVLQRVRGKDTQDRMRFRT